MPLICQQAIKDMLTDWENDSQQFAVNALNASMDPDYVPTYLTEHPYHTNCPCTECVYTHRQYLDRQREISDRKAEKMNKRLNFITQWGMSNFGTNDF